MARIDDEIRTVAYLALQLLGARLAAQEPGMVEGVFKGAKEIGLIDYTQNDDGTIYVFPLASKPPTQVASVEGIDAHRGMEDRRP